MVIGLIFNLLGKKWWSISKLFCVFHQRVDGRTYAHAHSHTHVRTRTHANTHTYKRTHNHIYAHAHTQTHRHTPTHTHTDTHKDTHTHTHGNNNTIAIGLATVQRVTSRQTKENKSNLNLKRTS